MDFILSGVNRQQPVELGKQPISFLYASILSFLLGRLGISHSMSFVATLPTVNIALALTHQGTRRPSHQSKPHRQSL